MYKYILRLLAAYIDLFIVSFPVITPMALLGYEFTQKYGYYFYLLGVVLFMLKDVAGRSIGKVIFKFNIYNYADFKKVPLWKRIVRNISTLFWPIELIIIVFSQDHQKLLDKLLNIKVQALAFDNQPEQQIPIKIKTSNLSGENNMLKWLMKWYKSNCDGDWEHSSGVKVETLDNPGWTVHINVSDTPLENKPFQEIKIDNGDDDWIFCSIKNNVFHGVGDPDKLEKIIELFKNWVEDNL